MKQIIVVVSQDGNVKIEASGYSGASCEKATKALEEAMGIPGKRAKKDEFYAVEVGQQKVGN